jgi:hypothetical protein
MVSHGLSGSFNLDIPYDCLWASSKGYKRAAGTLKSTHLKDLFLTGRFNGNNTRTFEYGTVLYYSAGQHSRHSGVVRSVTVRIMTGVIKVSGWSVRIRQHVSTLMDSLVSLVLSPHPLHFKHLPCHPLLLLKLLYQLF